MSERVLMPEWSGFTLAIPIKTERGSNNREHHFERATRVRTERKATYYLWIAAGKPKVWLPAEVELTRISPGQGLDDDNLRGALKGVRDEIAMIAGSDDSTKAPISWVYAQERGAWGVRVRVRPRAGA